MKHLKSSLSDLRQLFARAITLRDIAEPLASFDHATPAAEIRSFMEQREYDVVGVRFHGVVNGFVVRGELKDEKSADEYLHSFGNDEVLSDGGPLLSAFDALRTRRHIFVRILGHVGGIVTRGDLQKSPVRMWLFGLVSLLEMQMLRLVRERYPNGTWMNLLTEQRVKAAQHIFEERRRRKEENDLSDCLQLGDKGRILMKDPALLKLTGFASKQALENFFCDAAKLRDALAHSNDITMSRWPELVDLVSSLERTLGAIEMAAISPTGETLATQAVTASDSHPSDGLQSHA